MRPHSLWNQRLKTTRSLLFSEPNLTLKRTIKIWKLQESAENAQKELQQEAALWIVKHNRFNKDKPPIHDKHKNDSSKCRFSGYIHSPEAVSGVSNLVINVENKTTLQLYAIHPSIAHEIWIARRRSMKWNTNTKTLLGEISVIIQTAATTLSFLCTFCRSVGFRRIKKHS